MLTRSNSYSNIFLEHKRLFLDSTVLIDWAARPSVDAAFEDVQREYSLILCTASLLEVGFGAPGKAAASLIVSSFRGRAVQRTSHDSKRVWGVFVLGIHRKRMPKPILSVVGEVLSTSGVAGSFRLRSVPSLETTATAS